MSRQCSKTGCSGPAVATLTYVYRDSTAVLGPLATYAEPHTYDLCARHADRLTAPLGWEVVRLGGEYAPAARRLTTSWPWPTLSEKPADRAPRRGLTTPRAKPRPGAVETGRRGHLRVLRDS